MNKGSSELTPKSNPEDFISVIEGHPYIQALREIRADGDVIRLAAHVVLDRALDEMAIPKDHTPESRYS